MKAAGRVAFNTGVLYTKLLLTLFIGFFTTRLVLDALGQENYGIYMLVAGVIGMLSFLKAAMAQSSMRFISHSLGTGDKAQIRSTFKTISIIHLILAFILVIIMEAGGMLMFEYLLDIPAEKLSDAKIVFHFMVATTFMLVISVPYEAVINSHENMLALSVIDFSGVLLRFGIAVYLLHIQDNILIIYGLLMLIVQIMLRVVMQWYSMKKYDECKIQGHIKTDKKTLREILSFAGWTLFGTASSMTIVQVTSVLINMFFGVLLNAAVGVAMQVSNQLNNFAANLNKAIFPQIVKSEGAGNRDKMLNLTMIASKFSVFIFTLFALPVVIEIPYIMGIWLKEVPDFAILFSRLIIINMLLAKFTSALREAIRAVGKIRNYTLIESAIPFLFVPLSYYLFTLGYPPQTIYIVNIVEGLIATVLRIWFTKTIAGLNIKQFLVNNIIRTVIPIGLALAAGLLPLMLMEAGFLRLLLTMAIMGTFLLSGIRYIGLNRYELEKVRGLLKKLSNRFSLKKYSFHSMLS